MELLLGSLETENLLPVIVIIAGSVFCAAYLFPVIRIAYFEPAPDNDLKDPGLPQKIALILLSIMIIVLGTVPVLFLNWQTEPLPSYWQFFKGAEGGDLTVV